eukprot:3211087-Amphidinium_carterae.1
MMLTLDCCTGARVKQAALPKVAWQVHVGLKGIVAALQDSNTHVERSPLLCHRKSHSSRAETVRQLATM